jgi:hypothetical protein
MTPAVLSGPWGPIADALRRLPDVAESLRDLPWPGAVALLAVGAVMLAVGARARRPLAVVGGAIVGAAAGAAVSALLGGRLGVPPLAATAVLAAAGALAGGFFPPAFIFGAGALPGALVGLAFPAQGHAEVGALAGIAFGGTAAVLLARWVAAIAAAGIGATLLAAGLFAGFGRSEPLRALAAHPLALAGILAVLTVAGAAFQHASAWAPLRRAYGGPPPDEAPTVAEPR